MNEKCKKIKDDLWEYKRKEKALSRFKKLSKWGREFAKKNKITRKDILEND